LIAAYAFFAPSNILFLQYKLNENRCHLFVTTQLAETINILILLQQLPTLSPISWLSTNEKFDEDFREITKSPQKSFDSSLEVLSLVSDCLNYAQCLLV